jgi:hypothetical protein
MARTLYILGIFLFCTGTCLADVTLYLYPRVAAAPEIPLSQIASIEGDAETVARIKDVRVDEHLFFDGYLDRKELTELLAGKKVGKIHIIGSGVRIIRGANDAAGRRFDMAVKKGDTVRFQVVNSSIRIEIFGIAMQNGVPGDVIPVKLKGSKVVNGKVLNERTVGLDL